MKTFKRLLPMLSVASAFAVVTAVAQTEAPSSPTPAATSPAPAATPATPSTDQPRPAQGGALLPPAPAETSMSAAAGLDVGHVANLIKTQSFDSKDKLLTELRGRIDAADHAGSGLLNSSHRSEVRSQNLFDSAVNDYKKRKDSLENSLRAAQQATSDNWERVRLELAADYAFFAAGVAGLEVASH
jgi:hypothetical protein